MDNLAHDVKRKESQVKELQSRLDSGEGCKLICVVTIASSICHEKGKIFSSRLLMSIWGILSSYLFKKSTHCSTHDRK